MPLSVYKKKVSFSQLWSQVCQESINLFCGSERVHLWGSSQAQLHKCEIDRAGEVV